MKYEAITPHTYLEELENDWRKEKLLEIRKIIFEKEPSILEFIEYKMLGYGDREKSIMHLNAQKNYVSLYVGDIDKVDLDGELTKGIDRGKGCLRIKKSQEISETHIDKFIERVLDFSKLGKDIGC